jgi:hypothetical protein
MTFVPVPDARARSLRPGWRAAFGCCASVLIAWGAASARAQELADPELHWDAPAGCPGESAILDAVRHWLAQSAERLDPRAVRVDARITAQAGGFGLDLELQSPSGRSREQLRAERCETFVDVVALKVTLASPPLGAASTDIPPRAPAGGASRVLEADPANRAADPASPGQNSAIGVSARLLGGVGLGSLPGLAPNAAAMGSLRVGPFRFELGANYGFPSTVRYSSVPTAGAELQLLTGIAQACFSPLVRPVELPICAGIELGVMRGRGFGVSEAYTSDQLWAAAVLAPALRVPLFGPVSAWIELRGLAVLARPRYHVRNLDVLYEPERFAVRAMAGLEFALR